MSDRHTCWSVTQQVESEDEAKAFMEQPVPPGWKLVGQLETAPTTGKLHCQLMLKTPQLRFSSIKKQFPRAHIEAARDKQALALYVKKEDTRVAALQQPSTPTIWEFNMLVADAVDLNELDRHILISRGKDIENHPDAIYVEREWTLTDHIYKSAKPKEILDYIDKVVARMILSGVRGAEYMGVNPMFRSAWTKYGITLIERTENLRAYE